jgi:tetratricopeptide (TPR) repeat protein
MVTLALFLAGHRTGANTQPAQGQLQPQASANVFQPPSAAPIPKPAPPSDLQAVVEPRQVNGEKSPSASTRPESGKARPSFAQISSAKTAEPDRSQPEEANQRSTPDKQVHAALTEGDLFFENGEYDRAISAYQEGLRLDPKNRELLRKMEQMDITR